MGTAYAKSSEPSPTVTPIDPESDKTKQDTNVSADINPGSIEDLHKKCKDVFPNVFEGAKFMVNKALSNHFQISHTINMSSLSPSGYRFGATYVGTTQFGPMEAYPILLGDVDPSGNLNANIIHQYNNLRTKFAAQVQDSKFVASQLSADYKGSDYTASLTLGSIDVLNLSGLTVMHYLQSVTSSLAIGTELACQFGPHVPGGQVAMLSLAGRYTAPKYTLSGNIGPGLAHVCYYRKENDNVQVGVEVQTNFRMSESVCTLGYQMDLPKANVVFRGIVDSNWTVGAVMEKKLLPLPFTLILSGMINHQKNQSRFGIGFIIG